MKNADENYLIYIGGGRSSVQTYPYGYKTINFKKNEVYPEAFPSDYVTTLFNELPGQFRLANFKEVKSILKNKKD